MTTGLVLTDFDSSPDEDFSSRYTNAVMRCTAMEKRELGFIRNYVRYI